jgi:hypothetical protein
MNRNRRIDVPALVFGMIFLGAASWWLFDRDFALRVPNAGWLVAVLLIAGGAMGVAGAIRGGRSRGTDT